MIVRLLTMNIGNPSLERSKRQCEWLEKQNYDVLILTETKNSYGCQYISDYFFNIGNTIFSLETSKKYDVNFPISSTGDLGVMIISKYDIKNKHQAFNIQNRFYSRQSQVSIEINNKLLQIIGLYIPSRDRSVNKIQRKMEFINSIKLEIINNSNCCSIIAGDFNILDKTHIPHYSTFFSWEYDFYDFLIENKYVDVYRKLNPQKLDYSWFGRTGDGYRYDYIFVSSDIASNILNCDFIHESRLNKLTDHSALFMEIDI